MLDFQRFITGFAQRQASFVGGSKTRHVRLRRAPTGFSHVIADDSMVQILRSTSRPDNQICIVATPKNHLFRIVVDYTKKVAGRATFSHVRILTTRRGKIAIAYRSNDARRLQDTLRLIRAAVDKKGFYYARIAKSMPQGWASFAANVMRYFEKAPASQPFADVFPAAKRAKATKPRVHRHNGVS